MLFLLPAILLVVVFRIFPLVWGFAISLTSATSTSPGEFIGAGNYLRALADPNFRSSIANAGVVLLSVPVFVTIPMLLAILIAAPAAAAESPSSSLFGGYWSSFLEHWSQVFMQQNGVVMAALGLGAVSLFIITRGKWKK